MIRRFARRQRTPRSEHGRAAPPIWAGDGGTAPQGKLRDKSVWGYRNRGGDGFVWRILTTDQAKPRLSTPSHGAGAASSRTRPCSRGCLESSTNGCSITLASSGVFASAADAGGCASTSFGRSRHCEGGVFAIVAVNNPGVQCAATPAGDSGQIVTPTRFLEPGNTGVASGAANYTPPSTGEYLICGWLTTPTGLLEMEGGPVTAQLLLNLHPKRRRAKAEGADEDASRLASSRGPWGERGAVLPLEHRLLCLHPLPAPSEPQSLGFVVPSLNPTTIANAMRGASASRTERDTWRYCESRPERS
jgi:hypothetical protein